MFRVCIVVNKRRGKIMYLSVNTKVFRPKIDVFAAKKRILHLFA